MNTTNININKNLYKIFLSTVKYTPIFLAIAQTLNIATNYIGISAIWIQFLGGISFPFLLMLYIISYVFKFCYLYRIPLQYLTILSVVAIIDSLFGIPISTINMFRIYTIIFGVFIITFVVYMYKNRNKPKIDHLKQMCENYTKCCG